MPGELRHESVPTAHAGQRSSPLEAAHEAAGATFTDFAGYRMPVRYSSDLAEHHAVREAAGVFDLSHMAEIGVTGPDAVAFLDHALAGSFGAMPIGRAKYSLLLAEDGGILDDLVVYRTDDDVFLVVANASNREVAVDALHRPRRRASTSRSPTTPTPRPSSPIQGPAAAGTLDALVVADRLQPETPLDELGYYRVLHALFDGADVLVARTGYTGEDGFEVYSDPDIAPVIWDALLEAGADRGVVPAGLAARDTLRLEAGMPLYGHELGTDVRPAQAGLGRVVAKDGDFVGAAGVSPSDGRPRARRPRDRGAPRSPCRLRRRARRHGRRHRHLRRTLADARPPGRDGLRRPGPLAPPRGQVLHIDVRGTAIPSTVSAFPFYRRASKG